MFLIDGVARDFSPSPRSQLSHTTKVGAIREPFLPLKLPCPTCDFVTNAPHPRLCFECTSPAVLLRGRGW